MKKLLSLLAVAIVVCCAGVVLADEAVPTPIVPDQVEYLPTVTKGTITLTEGWNLIAIPVLPAEQLRIKDFIYKVEGGIPDYKTGDVSKEVIYCKPMWNISAVAVYKDGRFRTYTRDNATYNMVPGEAYFVHAEYLGPRPCYEVVGPQYPMPIFRPTTTVTIAGKCVKASVSLDLNKGWNGVALMGKKESLNVYKEALNPQVAVDGAEIIEPILVSSLRQLSGELSEQGVKATRIIFWDAYKQEWEQQALPFKGEQNIDGMATFIDRIISGSEGFFLLCDENGLYVPGLKQIQNLPDPPVPPIPPINDGRVYQYGQIERENTGDIKDVSACKPYNFVLVYWENVRNISPSGGGSLGYMVEHRIPVDGATEDIRQKLEAVAGNGQAYSVEGVMKTVEYDLPVPSYQSYKVDVLMVDRFFDPTVVYNNSAGK